MLVPLSYLLGAFPTALLIGKLTGHDPTTEGSGNPGASNVLRVAGRRAGAAVLVGDALKGAVPALVGLAVDGRPLAVACGVAAMAGHIAPVGRIRTGGKGVATLGGAVTVLNPIVALALMSSFLVVMWRFRIPALGSLTMAALLPIGLIVRGRPWWEVGAMTAAAALVAVRHRANIARLWRRDELTI